MRVLAFALALFAAAAPAVRAQEAEPPDGTRIVAAQVSGLELDRLSQCLRDDIAELVGTPLNRQQLKELAARIEAERPRYIVAVRISQAPDPGAHVAFVAACVGEEGQDANVNARYTVEDVSIAGISERRISQPLLDELHALAGKTFESEAAERLDTRLKDALPGWRVTHRTTRGSQPGLIRLIYEIGRLESSRFLRFEPVDGNALYHSDLGWGANLPLSMGSSHFRVTATAVLDSADDLAEEYSGFGLRVESRKVGTDRLGLMFDWGWYDSTWRDPTLGALLLQPDLPAPYGSRTNFTSMLKVALTRQLSVAGGVDVAELGSLDDGGPSQMANAATGAIRFSQQWTQASGARHSLGAVVSARAGTDALESDYTYERYFGQGDYSAVWGRQRVLASGMAGGISGRAPLFERFTLGDSRTLRGWSKYEIAPAGGDRMFAASVEYRYSLLMVFFDAGSVWDAGTDMRVRTSAGVGVVAGPFFAFVGFPLNTDDYRAVFATGLRFGLPPSGVKRFW